MEYKLFIHDANKTVFGMYVYVLFVCWNSCNSLGVADNIRLDDTAITAISALSPGSVCLGGTFPNVGWLMTYGQWTRPSTRKRDATTFLSRPGVKVHAFLALPSGQHINV
jgi:hypothetical protein